MFLRVELKLSTWFSFLLTQAYQLAAATSPDPLPGMITALVSMGMWGSCHSLVEVNQAII